MTQSESPDNPLRDYLPQRRGDVPPVSTWPADADHLRPGAPDDGRETVAFTLPGEITDGLDDAARTLQVSRLALLTTCLQVLLFRVRPSSTDSGTDADADAGEVVVGAATSRRRAAHWLPLRQTIDAAEPFGDLVVRAGADLREALSNRERSAPYPTADLASDCGVALDDVCRAILVLDAETDHGEDEGADFALPPDFGFTPDLVITLPAGEGHEGTLEVARKHYSRQSADRILAGFLNVVRGAVHTPRTAVGYLPIVSDPAGPSPAPDQSGGAGFATPAHELFERSAERYPDVPALRWDGGELSYAELRTAAEHCAARLGTPRVVALSGPRSPELVIALLAILKCGAAYAPLDPTYPRERLDYMLADSSAEVLVCPQEDAASFSVPDGVRVVDLGTVLRGTDDPGPASGRPITGEDLCYIIYTSGSTGQPKGVEMPHRPLASLLEWQSRHSAATTGWNTLQFAAFSFDVAFQEIFATWSTGGTLVLVGEETRRDPDRLLGHIIERRIHRLYAPFVALQQLAEFAVRSGRFPEELREVITAGEQLHVSPAIRQFFLRAGASLENQYGPSETHVVTAERLPADATEWPELPAIGTPIDRAVVEILDQRQQALPAGVPGEICVSGVPLAHGYAGKLELTEERFVHRGGAGDRTYRTGDFGRLLPDGRIQYLGRQDGQVKIRGLRVELGEIEARIKAQVGLADAVVVAPGSSTQARRVIAYYLLTAGFDVPPRALRRSLTAVLPSHMVPIACVPLTRLPLTPSGKVDRRELANRPLPEDLDAAYLAVREQQAGGAQHRPEHVDDTETDTPIQRVVAEVWAEALCRSTVGIHADLFTIGGNSRSALEVATLLSEIFRVKIPVRLLFDRRTVAEQASSLTEIDGTCAHSLDDIAQRLLEYDVEVEVDSGQTALSP
ncbi:MAG: amino acid adenylation domain-containing protein [Actinoallomurus sp.]